MTGCASIDRPKASALEVILGMTLFGIVSCVAMVGGSATWILWQDDRYGFPEGSSPCVENYGPGYEYGSDFQSCRPISKDKR